MSIQRWEDGVPCEHPGCLHHQTHLCEGCGRLGGRRIMFYTDHLAEMQKAREDAWLAGFDCAARMANGLTALTATQHLAQFLKSKEKTT